MPAYSAARREQHPRREPDLSRARLAEFVDELAHAGIRPAEHSLPRTSEQAQSVTLIGWSLEGCRGRARGCGPDCVTVVTTNGHLALVAEQPARSHWRHPRPRYLVLPEYPILQTMLARARAILLPRPMTA
ncbi:hypothetical protein ACFVUS_27800 [Nocardia sp. NPDC058058]|uniref:hypothetical protein n=1 Tax=Nocardia sp. NPDC058058 TaxID=3346317 RepID=UPI0036DCDA0D